MNPAHLVRAQRLFAKRIKEARIGDPVAQYDVGLMYANGEGVEKSIEQALPWLRAAAEKQHAGAQYLLANAYASGAGVDKSDAKAALWFLRAADGGYDKAALRLGKLLEAGHEDLVFQCYAQAAEQGQAQAQLKLADLYFRGQGVPQSYVQALHWYLKAAEQGLPPAQMALGIMHLQGLGVGVNTEKAGVWLRQAAKRGHPGAQMALERLDEQGWGRGGQASPGRRKRAPSRDRRVPDDRWADYARRGEPEDQYQLGLMYEGGIALEQDMGQAISWYTLAAERGHPQAQVALARIQQASDPVEAAKWYLSAVQQGSAEAAYGLGCLHLGGTGVEADVLRALFYFAQAAEQQHPQAVQALARLLMQDHDLMARSAVRLAAQEGQAQAQYDMGRCHAGGVGLPQDDAMACRWYALAAEQGHAEAQSALAVMYLSGRGVVRDELRAYGLFEHAAAQGDSRAQWNLGKLCSVGGEGFGRDARRASTLFKKAANVGYAPAQATLGTLYAQAKKYVQANEWWTKAAEQDDPEALFNLANAHRLGLGLTSDPAQSFALLLRAADLGLPAAQARLGLMYATGEGVAQDSIEACKWFVVGARMGEETAAANRERARAMLSAAQLQEGERRAEAWLRAWQNRP